MGNNYIVKGLLLAGMTVLITGFQNCSNARLDTVNDSAKTSATDDNAAADIDDGNDNPRDPVPIAKTCAELRDSGALRKMDAKIVFDDTKTESGRNQVCLFNQDGNLGMKNNFQQARYEQTRAVELPANAVLCDLTIAMETQSMKYDDMFYMTLNDVVIASNSSNNVLAFDTEAMVVSETGTLVPGYRYDWQKIVGTPFNNKGEADYCLGAEQGLGQCQWPKTERVGDFKFEYHQELLSTLGAKSNDTKHEIMFSITGDNDPKVDCYHEEFEFDVTATYYIEEVNIP